MKTNLLLTLVRRPWRGLYLERPGGQPYLKARSLLRWLSHHRRMRVWIVGTRRWSLLVLHDEGNDRPDPKRALAEVLWREQRGH